MPRLSRERPRFSYYPMVGSEASRMLHDIRTRQAEIIRQPIYVVCKKKLCCFVMFETFELILYNLFSFSTCLTSYDVRIRCERKFCRFLQYQLSDCELFFLVDGDSYRNKRLSYCIKRQKLFLSELTIFLFLLVSQRAIQIKKKKPVFVESKGSNC